MADVHVTNLNDSGAGSFRAACAVAGSRRIVFDVSGDIVVTSKVDLGEGDLTIDGSTNPVQLIGFGAYCTNVSNIIMQHMRLRPGPNIEPGSNDSFQVLGTSAQTLFQNCSMYYSQDEIFSVYGNHIKLDLCILALALSNSGHPDGEHSKTIFNNNTIGQVEVCNCLLVHAVDRNPTMAGGYWRFYNNVRYNTSWSWIAPVNSAVFADIMNNTVIIGDDVQPTRDHKNAFRLKQNTEFVPDTRFHLSGNTIIGANYEEMPEFEYVGHAMSDPICFTSPPRTAAESYTYVLANAGAWYNGQRDALDELVLADVVVGTGAVIDDPSEITGAGLTGGYPDMSDLL